MMMDQLHDMAPILQVSALPTGTLHLPDRWLFEDGDTCLHSARQFSPDYSFHIEHPSGRRILFDLGMRKDLQNNPKAIQADYDLVTPEVPEDAVDILAKGGVQPDDIDTIILSHLHFDHVGDCTLFPNTNIIAGPGSYAATTPGWPKKQSSPFLSAVLDHPKFQEIAFQPNSALPETMFEEALDFFGDGSLFVISTPGHMPGHLGAIVHSGTNEWIFLGGDCCHHRALLMDRRPMSVTVGPNGTSSFHSNPEVATKTIAKVRHLDDDANVFVALPHDASLMDILPLFPEVMNGWSHSEWKLALDKKVTSLYPPAGGCSIA
jgi:glyoxylase-like metal-dependent hydrolase (beta-lactamase superfamily II)